jgi:DNA helicase-2/ATP-dependent DNA helicase PcrA
VRQNDLGRLVRLAAELVELDGPGFVAELERRFGDGGEARRGVHLLTLHGAKGLEFETVFLARVEEKELPTRRARSSAEIAEERRLLYVGLTRAKRQLFVTWTRAPSRFLRELGLQPRQAPPRHEADEDDPVFAALKAWRLARAKADDVPAYVVFHNSTLAEIAGRKPRSLNELATVPGVGPSKLERFGDDVLAILDGEVASATS